MTPTPAATAAPRRNASHRGTVEGVDALVAGDLVDLGGGAEGGHAFFEVGDAAVSFEGGLDGGYHCGNEEFGRWLLDSLVWIV